MKSQVDVAVLNNIIWCGIVCDTHEIAQTSKGHVWGLLSKAPIFYPDIITLNRNVTIEDVKDFIGTREITSIKDSYANLDMSSFGFKILLEAEWIYHAPVTDVELIHTSWRVITTEKDLLQWTFANGTENVIKSNLLQQKNVKMFIREHNGEISGFIANLGANAVGISNVFSADNAIESLWIDITKIVSTEFPGLPMVGYEQSYDLTAALLSGWTSVGPLRVWIKEKH
ncbi:hypothetical protein [Paenibacillus sp. RC67]|uniref:hypothetical protein n=1 Tax=Paenibacillus sp. RC67 TaxID=3039392 RepID=UPI0024AD3826|nr:hypothetical protein [Paenibacillus sp. RC67]